MDSEYFSNISFTFKRVGSWMKPTPTVLENPTPPKNIRLRNPGLDTWCKNGIYQKTVLMLWGFVCSRSSSRLCCDCEKNVRDRCACFGQKQSCTALGCTAKGKWRTCTVMIRSMWNRIFACKSSPYLGLLDTFVFSVTFSLHYALTSASLIVARG